VSSPSLLIGCALGLLIALVTGTIFVFMLKSLSKAITWGDGLKVVAEMLAVPTFWFGGPWIAARALTSLDWPKVLPPYALTLAVVFTILTSRVVFRYLKFVAQEIG